MDKNIIVFARARTGTTSFCNVIYNKIPEFEKHCIAYEFLNNFDAFIPRTKKSLHPIKLSATGSITWRWQKWLTMLYTTISNNDHDKMNEFYLEHILPSDDFYFHEYYIKNKKICRRLKPWQKIRKFVPNFYNIELSYRLNLLDEDIYPYHFKYFPGHIEYDTWIDRKNTTVIVIVRNNILAGLASKLRIEISNLADTPTLFNIQSGQQQNYIDRTKLANRLINADYLQQEIQLHKDFINRVQLLNPDVIISYETLVQNNILNMSGYKKVNLEPIAIFFENYVKAEEIVKDITPLADKNVALLEDILGVPVNG
jgi:hypothetical protein